MFNVDLIPEGMSKVANSEQEISEAQKRRKRINLYKRIIVILIIAMILLPTILCVVLFLRLNYVSNKLDELSKVVYGESSNLVVDNDTIEESGEKGTEPDYYNSNTNKPDKKEDPTEPTTVPEEPTTEVVVPPTTQVPTTERTEEETTQPVPLIPGATEYSDEVKQALSEGRKVVYLTFDDGPWTRTDDLLNILKSYGVKATFFVNYHAGYEKELLRMRDEGHTIAMHTYSHVYEHVYGDINEFSDEVFKLQNYLYSVTGVKSMIFRFPGGSSNSKTDKIDMYVDYLNKNGIVYYDWNVSSADATPGGLPADKICNNVINGIKGKDVSVVLMHDAYNKDTTLEAVPMIIEKLQAMNALILPITADTVPVHHNF